MATEQPRYELIFRAPGFEVRQYGPGMVAETQVSGGSQVSGSEAFRRLAGYIFGGNQHGRSIAMTAPVVQRPDAEDRWTVRFHMPAAIDPRELPAPMDGRVRLRPVPSRRLAVRRYTGDGGASRFLAEAASLAQAIEAANLRPAGPPEWARYDPPWVPPMRRTTEVMIPVE